MASFNSYVKFPEGIASFMGKLTISMAISIPVTAQAQATVEALGAHWGPGHLGGHLFGARPSCTKGHGVAT